jgi:hypothetical protein
MRPHQANDSVTLCCLDGEFTIALGMDEKRAFQFSTGWLCPVTCTLEPVVHDVVFKKIKEPILIYNHVCHVCPKNKKME